MDTRQKVETTGQEMVRSKVLTPQQMYGFSDAELAATRADLPNVVRSIKSSTNNPEELLLHVTRLRKLSSLEQNAPLDEVINENAIPLLMDLLDNSSDARLVFECAW